MRRRELVRGVVGLTAMAALPRAVTARASKAGARLMTVGGWLDTAAMGMTLAHEHAVANFQNYTEWLARPLPYDPDDVVKIVLPRLLRLRDLGIRTFVDATAVGLGRDPGVLRRLSEASGLHILTVTGNYAALGYAHLPPAVYSQSPQALAQTWIREWTDGIAGTGIRPGLIKLGFNGGTLSDVERTLIRAGAIAHLRTGLTIGAHTGPAKSAFEQMAELEGAGVDPSAWIWIHAQNEPNSARHVEAAQRGAWVEFDGIDRDTVETHVKLVSAMRDAGVLEHVLLSQDAGWYTVGQPGGGTARSYEPILTDFLPALRAAGFGQSDIDTLLVRNPARAFAVAVRRIGAVTSSRTPTRSFP